MLSGDLNLENRPVRSEDVTPAALRPVTLCLKGAGTVFTSRDQDEYQIGRICLMEAMITKLQRSLPCLSVCLYVYSVRLFCFPLLLQESRSSCCISSCKA